MWYFKCWIHNSSMIYCTDYQLPLEVYPIILYFFRKVRFVCFIAMFPGPLTWLWIFTHTILQKLRPISHTVHSHLQHAHGWENPSFHTFATYIVAVHLLVSFLSYTWVSILFYNTLILLITCGVEFFSIMYLKRDCPRCLPLWKTAAIMPKSCCHSPCYRKYAIKSTFANKTQKLILMCNKM